MRIAVIAITAHGAAIGKKLMQELGSAELHVSARYGNQADPSERLFEPTELKDLLSSLWNRVDGFVFIMATGIVVRLVAPLLKSKAVDPAVTVIDDQGNFAISLLSGHLGGANELACRCAAITGAQAVITTATDAAGLPSFDMLAKELGWVISDLSRVKILNSLLLDGSKIAVGDESGRICTYFQGRGNLSFHESVDKAINCVAEGFVLVTNRSLPPEALPEKTLVLRPRNIVLGIGCNRGTPAEEIEAFVTQQLHRLHVSAESLHSIATAEAKRDEPGLITYAKKLGLPLQFYSSAELNQMPVPTPPSQYVLDAIGATGVAEPAALLSAGRGPLLLQKVKSVNVTLAVAELLPGANHGVTP